MPFTLPNGSRYKLLLLDTNVLSNISKNENNEREIFIKKFISVGYAPCFSFQSVIELKKSTKNGRCELYNKFLLTFSEIPCLILYPYKRITDQEIKYYLEEGEVKKEKIDLNMAMLAFSPLGSNDTYNFKKFVTSTLTELANIIFEEEKENEITLRSWIRERNEYKRNHKVILYHSFEKEFFEIFFSHVEKRLLSIKYNINDFLAIKMMAITKYDRLFKQSKKMGVNDVYDVLISSYTPYVDAILTERHQAEVIKQGISKMPILKEVERYTLADLN